MRCIIARPIVGRHLERATATGAAGATTLSAGAHAPRVNNSGNAVFGLQGCSSTTPQKTTLVASAMDFQHADDEEIILAINDTDGISHGDVFNDDMGGGGAVFMTSTPYSGLMYVCSGTADPKGRLARQCRQQCPAGARSRHTGWRQRPFLRWHRPLHCNSIDLASWQALSTMATGDTITFS